MQGKWDKELFVPYILCPHRDNEMIQSIPKVSAVMALGGREAENAGGAKVCCGNLSVRSEIR